VQTKEIASDKFHSPQVMFEKAVNLTLQDSGARSELLWIKQELSHEYSQCVLGYYCRSTYPASVCARIISRHGGNTAGETAFLAAAAEQLGPIEKAAEVEGRLSTAPGMMLPARPFISPKEQLRRDRRAARRAAQEAEYQAQQQQLQQLRQLMTAQAEASGTSAREQPAAGSSCRRRTAASSARRCSGAAGPGQSDAHSHAHQHVSTAAQPQEQR